MRCIAAVATSIAFIVAAAAPAAAGPVKHWGTFPGREVRAVAFRGDAMGSEPSFVAVQGRDGYVYLRGRFGLYRVLALDGSSERVADTSHCSGWFESQGADTRSFVPRAICDRASEIIIAVSTALHLHVRTPAPDWSAAIPKVEICGYDQPAGGTPSPVTCRRDSRFLTAVVPAAGGGYWFANGMVGGIGRVWPSGRAAVAPLAGFRRILSVAARGEDVYLIDERCRFGHVRGLTLVDSHRIGGRGCHGYFPSASVVATGDGALWALGSSSGIVERYGGDGSHRAWTLAMIPAGVAVSRDGTAYVLGYTREASLRFARPAIAAIAPHRVPQVRLLPMGHVGMMSIAIDARDRLWISDPLWHAAALISPTGARS